MLNVTELYETHLDRLYAFFAYRVVSIADAEDLTSTTFERIVRHAGRFDPARGSVTTWVFSIAENALIDFYRRQGRRDEQPFDEAVHDRAVGGESQGIGVSPQLLRAIDSLSERERRVIGLRFGGDLSGREIAEVVGLTEANVHQILSRALRRMRDELGSASAAR